MRTAAKIATLGHFGSKKDDDGAGKTKAQKRQRAVRLSASLLIVRLLLWHHARYAWGGGPSAAHSPWGSLACICFTGLLKAPALEGNSYLHPLPSRV